MEEHHHHHHHHHAPAQQRMSTIFIVCIVLNLLFVGVEAAIGFITHSLSLLSDAGHNLSDVFSLLLVLVGFALSKLPANKQFTYGYKKSTVLISLLNALLLLIAVGAIIVESINKFAHPVAIDGAAISWTAGAGIIVNGVTAWLLMKGQKEDMNVRGAFLHMVADTLVSVGVLVSGLVIHLTNWWIVDPIVSLVVALVIVVSTWDLLRDSMRETLDGMPEGINFDEIKEHILAVEHVKDVHHVHIWALSTSENALTAHLQIDDLRFMHDVKMAVKSELKEHNISHSTLEIEALDEPCPEADTHCGQS